jgi:nicotinamide riboside kinase
MKKSKTAKKKPLRILLYGAECTGKSTLGQRLAAHYNAPLVMEYARTYAEQVKRPLDYNDVLPIARGQAILETKAWKQAVAEERKLIVVDTDARMSWMYSDLYNEEVPPWVVNRALYKKYDVILFCQSDGIEWQADPVRTGTDPRYVQTAQLRFLLQMTVHLNEPMLPLYGTEDERFEHAIKMIDHFL